MAKIQNKNSWLKAIKILLIIATVIIIVFFFIQPNGDPLITTCLPPASAYTCIISSYNNGTLNVTVGQSTGSNWAVANIIYLPQGEPPPTIPQGALGFCEGSNSTAINSNAFYGSGILCPNPQSGLSSLSTGQKVTLVFTSSANPPLAPSTRAAGILEAYYQINNNTWYRTQIGQVTITTH